MEFFNRCLSHNDSEKYFMYTLIRGEKNLLTTKKIWLSDLTVYELCDIDMPLFLSYQYKIRRLAPNSL